jgi:hypothetical protein
MHYLRIFLEELIRLPGGLDFLRRAKLWLAVHNYTVNHPPAYQFVSGKYDYPDWACSFLGYRLQAEMVFAYTGHPIPVVSTEGGPTVGNWDDKTLPEVTEAMHADWAVETARYMSTEAEPWYFALNNWLIANFVRDPDAASAASFTITLPLILVSGSLFPASQLPGFLQAIAAISPLTYLNDGLRNAMVTGNTGQAVVDLAIIAALGIVLLGIGVVSSRWRDS